MKEKVKGMNMLSLDYNLSKKHSSNKHKTSLTCSFATLFYISYASFSINDICNINFIAFSAKVCKPSYFSKSLRESDSF